MSVIPGAAHIDLGRAGRGLVLFFLFACAANGALIAPFMTAASGVRTACALAAAGIWVVSLYDGIRVAARLRAAATASALQRSLDSGNTPEKGSERPVGERSG